MRPSAARQSKLFVNPLPRSDRKRVLVIAPHSSYRTRAFLDAGERLDIEIVIASEGKHSVVAAYAAGVHIDLNDVESALQVILNDASEHPFEGVIGTDDLTIELAARVAQKLGLPHNPPEVVRTASRKDLARGILADKGVPVPKHCRIDLRQPLAAQAEHLHFPCVLKPLTLSASRGVIRTNDLGEFLQACARIQRLLETEGVSEPYQLLAEDFIPGTEVALEGMLTESELAVLSIFDKPDPLDGPYFEETYYVTPSRLDAATQALVQEVVGDACRAYGLRDGPIHAECRINDDGVWILEVAARTIGGLCGRLLDLGIGRSLEELVLSHAMGRPLAPAIDSRGGAGVLMIPTLKAGILRRVEGLTAAQRVPFVDEVSIQVREGYELVPWPEGSSYLGFIFAHAPTPAQAEAALREAHACLNIVVAPLWSLNKRD